VRQSTDKRSRIQEILSMKNGFMSSRLLKLVAATALAAGATLAYAQEATRIGFVNTERILRDAAPAKASQQKLEQEFSRREQEIQDMAARLKSMGERIDRDAAVMSDADRQRRQREYADVEKEFQRKQREFREDLNQRRNEELAQVIEKANRVIKQIAEQEKYDIILQEAVFAAPRIDITEKVLRALSTGGK
jgi:outer membrane protein